MSIMVHGKPRDTITQFLRNVEKVYKNRAGNKEEVKCIKLLVEDHYEVDEQYSVEECLGDMMRVIVIGEVVSQ